MPPEGFPRERCQAATRERLGYFRASTIAPPRLKAVSDALWRAIQAPAGRALMLVIGPTGKPRQDILYISGEFSRRYSAGSPRAQ